MKGDPEFVIQILAHSRLHHPLPSQAHTRIPPLQYNTPDLVEGSLTDFILTNTNMTSHDASVALHSLPALPSRATSTTACAWPVSWPGTSGCSSTGDVSEHLPSFKCVLVSSSASSLPSTESLDILVFLPASLLKIHFMIRNQSTVSTLAGSTKHRASISTSIRRSLFSTFPISIYSRISFHEIYALCRRDQSLSPESCRDKSWVIF